METETQNTMLLTDNPPARLSGEVTCHKCGRSFKNETGLRMHTIRKHSGRGWSTAQNFHHKKGILDDESPRQRALRLAKKRAYQLKLRQSYYARGLDSKGQVPTPGYKPRGRNSKVREQSAAPPAQAQSAASVETDAASAILVAAQVIRAVATGIKIGRL